MARKQLRERQSRSVSNAASELHWELRPLLLPYNDRWRRDRKLMHQLTRSYQPVQDYKLKKLLVSILERPSEYDRWFEQYASGVVFRIGFGKWVETGEEIKRIMKVNHNLERLASPGSYLVDSFPVLGLLPEFLAPFKKEGQRLHEEEIGLFRELQDDARREIQSGVKSHSQSFTRMFLEDQDNYHLSDDEGAYVMGTLFEAGSGTTAAAMMSYFGNRMPGFTDIPNLPTVRAVIKEVLRWRPVTAGGFPHKLTKDDEYKGYVFKSGTTFHPNQWAIHRDPELYPDPENFRPDRWLDPQFPTYREPLSQFPNLQNFSCFGFGRRICPGQNIAERSLHILTARIAWAGSIVRKRELSPPPLYDYTKGFNTQSEHFDFDMVVRSPDRHEAIVQALREARKRRPV
ncbi:cytochrome P450 [Aspergillus pseudoustus]|uniref:Cytochrome P450 n=1 Tax=Aspergillus pseudoustus TaxID=1810923 RepID=A0ABR4IW18_9EURO